MYSSGHYTADDAEAVCVRKSIWCEDHSKAMIEPWPRIAVSPSLFCFAVTLPLGDEPELIIYQYWKRMGIFACNAHSLFSERSVWLIPGRLRTSG
eukprot:CAMPEP_0180623150 /NCGR_PEP_ID=MMETSP1037_2-20121125/36070_1 /TAXON_ID=632150 /ORGANISM="Azadinium spinosum, Strain 3D9" /LENGTH=94 /DNA_ID=CAMNT_0022643457 /DNA_START=677 /DNA_END=958 /DNA_ORIENTATION=-